MIILPDQSAGCRDEYLLSIGRIFHKIVLKGSTITVTGYRPRHPYPTFRIHYRYRLQTPDHATYDVSWVDFIAEKLENYNWNHLDHYICTHGDRDFALTESLKYWRLRLCVLPANPAPDASYPERVMRSVICFSFFVFFLGGGGLLLQRLQKRLRIALLDQRQSDPVLI